MGFLLLLGYTLTAGGPIILVFWSFIAKRSFLVLLTLASMFFWLTGLQIISLLLRGLLSRSLWPFGAGLALFLAVFLEEAMRYGLWRADRKLREALNNMALKRNDGGLSPEERTLISLTHGFAQGAVHSVLFFASYAPLTISGGTYYVEACPRMSYFMAAALMSLAFFLLHTACTLLAFHALDANKPDRYAFVVSTHVVAALLSLGNLFRNGCLVVIPALLVIAVMAAAAAAHLAWESVWQVPEHGFRPLPSAESEQGAAE